MFTMQGKNKKFIHHVLRMTSKRLQNHYRVLAVSNNEKMLSPLRLCNIKCFDERKETNLYYFSVVFVSFRIWLIGSNNTFCSWLAIPAFY